MSKWPLVPLGDVLRQRDPDVEVTASTQLDPVGVYSFGRGLFRRPRISGSETKYAQMTTLHGDDFVYSKLKVWEGAAAVVSSEFIGGVVSQEFPVFDLDDARLDSSYLGYYVRTEQFNASVRQVAAGIGARRDRVHPKAMLSILAPMPSLPEQRSIAAWLSRIEARNIAVDGWTRRVDELAGGIGQRMIESLFDCERVPLGTLVRVERDAIEIVDTDTYEAIGVRSFGRGLIRYPPQAGSRLGKLRFFSFPVGSLIVSNIKAWEGALAMSDDSDSVRIASNRFIPLQRRPGAEIELKFVLAFLLSTDGLAQLGMASPGSADRNRTTSVERLLAIPIPRPARQVQLSIVRCLDHLAKVAALRHSRVLGSLLPAAINQVFGDLT